MKPNFSRSDLVTLGNALRRAIAELERNAQDSEGFLVIRDRSLVLAEHAEAERYRVLHDAIWSHLRNSPRTQGGS